MKIKYFAIIIASVVTHNSQAGFCGGVYGGTVYPSDDVNCICGWGLKTRSKMYNGNSYACIEGLDPLPAGWKLCSSTQQYGEFVTGCPHKNTGTLAIVGQSTRVFPPIERKTDDGRQLVKGDYDDAGPVRRYRFEQLIGQVGDRSRDEHCRLAGNDNKDFKDVKKDCFFACGQGWGIGAVGFDCATRCNGNFVQGCQDVANIKS